MRFWTTTTGLLKQLLRSSDSKRARPCSRLRAATRGGSPPTALPEDIITKKVAICLGAAEDPTANFLLAQSRARCDAIANGRRNNKPVPKALNNRAGSLEILGDLVEQLVRVGKRTN